MQVDSCCMLMGRGRPPRCGLMHLMSGQWQGKWQGQGCEPDPGDLTGGVRRHGRGPAIVTALTFAQKQPGLIGRSVHFTRFDLIQVKVLAPTHRATGLRDATLLDFADFAFQSSIFKVFWIYVFFDFELQHADFSHHLALALIWLLLWLFLWPRLSTV